VVIPGKIAQLDQQKYPLSWPTLLCDT